MVDPLVCAVDIGTGSVRAIGFGSDGRRQFEARRSLKTTHPQPGYAEQDPEEVVAATLSVLTEVAAVTRAPITALSFSAQLYSVMAIDVEGTPLTPSYPWTDTRAVEEAAALRSVGLVAETGCPTQPIYPLSKIAWLRSHHSLPSDARFVAIKDHVLHRLTGHLVSDWSTASASGLLDVAARSWSEAALAAVGIEDGHLPPLASPSTILETKESALRELGFGEDLVIVLGAGDAPLASIGSGASQPSVLAVNIGTSAAARRFIDSPTTDQLGRLWTYVATDSEWVTGGIVGSAGAAFDWLVRMLLGGGDTGALEEATRLAASIEPGAGGVTFLPHLAGQQSPSWEPEARGLLAGLALHHDRAHLLRAALEGIVFALERVRRVIDEAASPPVQEIAVSGGLAAPRFVRQLLADVFDLPVRGSDEHEGSARGAALLALDTIGVIDGVDSLPCSDGTGHITPNAEAHVRYLDAFEAFIAHATHRNANEGRP